MDQDQSVLDARAKLKARMGNTQLGGKGAYIVQIGARSKKMSFVVDSWIFNDIYWQIWADQLEMDSSAVSWLFESDICFGDYRNSEKEQEGCSSPGSQRRQKTQANH